MPKVDVQGLFKFAEYFKADRVIGEVNQIVNLFSGQCPEIGCNGIWKVTDHKIEGGVLLIQTHRCSTGHGGVWSSSAVLAEKWGQKLCLISAVGILCVRLCVSVWQQF